MKASAPFALMVLVLLSGCASNPQNYISSVDGEIQKQIASDIFSLVVNNHPPAKTEVTIVPGNPGERLLEEEARQAGYQVHRSGDNPMKFDTYYLSSEGVYVGTISIGLFHRYTKQYTATPEGVFSDGNSAVAY